MCNTWVADFPNSDIFIILLLDFNNKNFICLSKYLSKIYLRCWTWPRGLTFPVKFSIVGVILGVGRDGLIVGPNGPIVGVGPIGVILGVGRDGLIVGPNGPIVGPIGVILGVGLGPIVGPIGVILGVGLGPIGVILGVGLGPIGVILGVGVVGIGVIDPLQFLAE
jgi:hypothetical protein